MKENFAQKDSFRAKGAFVAPAIEIYQKTYVIPEVSDVKHICECVIRELENQSSDFIEQIKKIYGDFDSFAVKQTGIYHGELIKMLAYIHAGNLVAAKKLAEYELLQGNSSGFKNKGMDIYEYIVRYCKKNV